jgi:hypothetical protein
MTTGRNQQEFFGERLASVGSIPIGDGHEV